MSASEIDHNYDNDPPSLSASLEDFEPSPTRRPPFFTIPSTHSGFRSEEPESESESDTPWNPPAWRKAGSAWFRTSAGTPSQSRETSPQYESAEQGEFDDDTVPANVPLPSSPLKQSPRASPEPAEKVLARRTPAPEDYEDAPEQPHPGNNCEQESQPYDDSLGRLLIPKQTLDSPCARRSTTGPSR